MRGLGAGPHADQSDDRSSTWVRGQSEITRKISNSTIRWTDVTAEQQLEQTRGGGSPCDLYVQRKESETDIVFVILFCILFSAPPLTPSKVNNIPGLLTPELLKCANVLGVLSGSALIVEGFRAASDKA